MSQYRVVKIPKPRVTTVRTIYHLDIQQRLNKPSIPEPRRCSHVIPLWDVLVLAHEPLMDVLATTRRISKLRRLVNTVSLAHPFEKIVND